MALTLWISFGGPRPSPEKLPLSALGCAFNVTIPEPSSTVDPTEHFYLYRVSYLWTSPVSIQVIRYNINELYKIDVSYSIYNPSYL